MINYNGSILDNSEVTIEKNRGFLYGDAIFETIKVANGKILFSEEHYFRLMASMRICRMEIPMNFTFEYFEEQIKNLVNTIINESKNYRVRVTFFRDSDGFYFPISKLSSFIISAQNIENDKYSFSNLKYEVELYKDFYISKNLLSTLKTNNRMINVTGSIFASENEYDNCLLLNEEKNVVEALNGNIFLKTGNLLVTPPLSDGCLKGIMRNQIISILKNMEDIEFTEKSISPFELQKADELFISNVIQGIQPVTKYRKKEFSMNFSEILLEKINSLV